MSASDEIILDGKKYISSRRAGEITRYTNDYIGQLCRAGKVDGKLIGRIRFVDEASLLSYKAMLDSGVKEEGLNTQIPPAQDFSQTASPSYFPPLKKGGLEGEAAGIKKSVDDLWGKISYAGESAQASANLSKESGGVASPSNPPSFRSDEFLPTPAQFFRREIISKIVLTLLGVSAVAGVHAFSSDPALVGAGGEMLASAKKEITLKKNELAMTADALVNNARAAFAGTMMYSTSFAGENKISSLKSLSKDAKDENDGKEMLASASLAMSEKTPAAVSFAEEAVGILQSVLDITSRSIYRAISPFFEQTKQAIVRSLQREPSESNTQITTSVPSVTKEPDQTITAIQTELSNLKSSLRAMGNAATPSTRIIYQQPITQITELGISDAELKQKLEQYNNKLVAMINELSSRGDTQTQNVYRAVSLSNKIDNLSNVTATSLTVSGVSGLTDADIPNNITASNYLATSGGTVTGLVDITGSGTSTISSNLLVLGSLAIGGTCINCSSGGGGSLTATGVITGPYFIATSTSATSTIAGQLVLNSVPTMAHTFPAWSIGASNSNANNASFYINPASAAADTNILGIAVNGSVKFMIDAEGDVFANSITSVGGETLSTTSVSTLTIENNTTLGDSTTTDKTYFNSRIGSSLFPTANNALDFGDGTNWLTWRTGYFGTSIGVGGTATTTGSNLLSSGAFTIDSKGTLSLNTTNNQNIVTGTGNVGLGTSTPYSKVTIWGNSSTDGNALEVSDSASSTIFSITNTGETTAIGFNATRSTTTQATTTNLAVSGFASTSNLTVSNIFNSNGTFTALGLSTLANLLMTGSTTLQNFTAVNSTTTNATTTSLQVAQTASTTNLIVSNTLTTHGSLVTNGLATLANLLMTGSTTLQNFTAVNSTTTAATTTNLAVTGFATTTSLTVSSTITGNGTLTVSGLTTLANLLMTGSTTLQNFTAVNSTTTNATTTSFAVSSLTSGRIPYLTTGGAFIDNSKLTFDGTRLNATYASSTSLSTSGSAYFATSGGSVGVGTTNPSAVALHMYSEPAGYRKGLLLSTDVAQGLSLWHDSAGNTTSYIDSRYDSGGAAIKFRMRANSTATVTAMTIYGDGNVGIGAEVPSKQLEIKNASGNATMRFQSSVIATDLYSETSDSRFYVVNGGSGGVFLAGSATSWGAVSDERLKDILGNIQNATDKLSTIRTVYYKFKADSTNLERVGVIAQDVQQVLPEAVDVANGTGYLGVRYTDLIPLTIKGINELNTRTGFISSAYGTSTLLSIDSSGNIGIGTTTPAYKLHVMGDVAAQSFVNISTRSAKTDIQYLTEEDDSAILGKLSQTNVATYYYNNDLASTGGLPTASTTRRFGLIAEEAPSEVLSADKKGVDIYKLGSFLFAGVKAEQKEIAKLSSRLDTVESILAASGGAQTDSLFAWIVEKFNMLGITFTQGVVRATNFIADNLTTKKVTTGNIEVGSASNRSGFTLYDKLDGKPYCVQIVAGALSSTMGPANLSIGTTYADLGVVVTDNVDQNLGYKTYVNGILEQTISLDTSANTTYEIAYTSTDNAGNTATTTRTVVVGTGTPVLDSTPPVITLSGLSIVTLAQNDTYTDAGATALDDTDGDLTANIIVNNPVNTQATSTYTVTYDVTDAAGNQA
ncbi:MAG: DUF5011 domain-containing protein, partial [Candidatus Lloydbacteria bacterium]|nr:DUF5011 domain-containing protein [Candidatus Lloydbacteria bacterium]